MIKKIISLLITVILFNACSDKQSTVSESKNILVDADVHAIKARINELVGDKPVLVNVWATWCIPCIEEFPYLMKLNNEYGSEFEMILISGDFPEAREEARGFLSKQGVDFETYFKTGKDNEFIIALSDEWTGAIPFTMILNRDGSLSSSWEGAADFKKFESELLKVID